MNAILKKKIRRKLSKGGFTLVEVMVSLFIVVVGIIGSMAFFVSAIAATKTARDTTLATTHAEYILEDMQTKEGLQEIVDTDWVVFWDSLVEGNIVESLDSETVSVIYKDIDADPLNVIVLVNWETSLRDCSTSIMTEATNR
ncbi:MAG: prepilin-type N-terminal cleavage/methylation domain-containing protein [Candidatus Zapsychrus exili]|nr:prepilin-type N-terminal cleavage/methylation domain-containing protein [Candidatus Zapsychrus exili]